MSGENIDINKEVSAVSVVEQKPDVYIEVRNMTTNKKKSYRNLSPKEAVVRAFEEERENYHHWMYAEFDKHPDAFDNPKSVMCGDWICRKTPKTPT